MHFVIRTDADAGAITTIVREKMRRLDPELAVAQVSTIEALLSRNFAEPRFNAALFGGLAVCALLLAIVGIYGVVSCSGSAADRGDRGENGARSGTY
jgi:putative ABC transport system permease protein